MNSKKLLLSIMFMTALVFLYAPMAMALSVNSGSGNSVTIGSGNIGKVSGGTLTNGSGSTIQGNGTLDVSGATFSNAGDLNPGASAGILTITGNFPQTSTGALNIEIGGTSAGTSYDQLNVSGSATLSGTLNVSLINSFSPSAGNTFQIVNYASGSGSFNTLNLPALAGGLEWETDIGTSSITLTVNQTDGGGCTYSILPVSATFNSDGGTGSVSVSTSSDCSWTAKNNASWIMITSDDIGTGNGSISYSVSANTGTSSRTGTITIEEKTFVITQNGSDDDGVLSAPTNFSSSVDECTTSFIGTSCTVSLSWTGVSEASGYKLYYGYSSGSYETPLDLGNVTSVTYNGIPENTYYLAISAYDSSGNESDKSDEIALIVGDSSVPTNFSAIISDCIKDIFGSSICTVSLNWTGVNGAFGYYLHYGFSSGDYAGFIDVGNVTSVSFAGIVEGIYYLALTSYDSGSVESGFSDELTLEVGTNSDSVIKANRCPSPFVR